MLVDSHCHLDYNDFEDVTYQEAVDVMSAIGVIDGMNIPPIAVVNV